MTVDVIATYDLSKQYDAAPALDRLNLQVREGGAFACVGREASGKTTLVRLLSGLCRPTSGECTVLGFSPFFEADRLHAAAGVVLDAARLYENMTLDENLRFFAGLGGVDENDAIDRISFLLHRLDIWESRDVLADDLPTGVMRRASLARALVHSPKVLLMDEPARGVNKETADSTKELLSHLVKQEGMTLLYCTRNMAYAQELCESYGLLRDGVMIAKGDLESLRQGAGVRNRAVLRLEPGGKPPRGFRLREDGQWQKEIASEEEMPNIVFQVVGSGTALYEARLERPGLEEIYAACLAGGAQRAGVNDEQDDGYEEPTERTDTDDPDGEAVPGAAAPEADAGEWPGAEAGGDGEVSH